MLAPDAVEWDEYFGMCALHQRKEGKLSSEAESKMAKSRISKIRQCRHGVFNLPIEYSDKVEEYLRHNQLSTLVEISHNVGVGHDTLKEVLYQGRKNRFFMFRTDVLGDGCVYYSTLEDKIFPADVKRLSKRQRTDRKSFVVRWMNYRKFIDPKFFHLPMNMKESALIRVLRDLEYYEEAIGVRQDRRVVFFEGPRWTGE
jgi:hypothetical protein